MKSDRLYHFFPREARNFDAVLSVLRSIADNGLFLTYEQRRVEWDDRFGRKKRGLKMDQHRFCLTAITHKQELIEHSNKFGCIGIGFSMGFIVRLGGFPVFYVPSPDHTSDDDDRYKGISLLYRLAETQEILEAVIRRGIRSEDIDMENVLGAVKFLANICYPTDRLVEERGNAVNYYNQREWRIIYGMVSEKADVLDKIDHYEVRAFENKPIIHFVEHIVVNVAELGRIGGSVEDVQRVMQKLGLRDDILDVI